MLQHNVMLVLVVLILTTNTSLQDVNTDKHIAIA